MDARKTSKTQNQLNFGKNEALAPFFSFKPELIPKFCFFLLCSVVNELKALFDQYRLKPCENLNCSPL